jgi:hypothetical protein
MSDVVQLCIHACCEGTDVAARSNPEYTFSHDFYLPYQPSKINPTLEYVTGTKGHHTMKDLL